jgi:hypothetical protein
MLICKIANSRALDAPTPSHSFGESTSGNAIYRPSVRPDRTDPPAPCLAHRAPCASCFVRPTCASRRLCLAPCSAAHRTSRSDSHCAQQRYDLCAMALSSVPASSSTSTSVHCGAVSRWAHVATVYFMHFRCMLNMIYLDVAKYIWCCIYCNNYTRMLQVYVSAVLNVCCKCFVRMFHMLNWLYIYVANVYCKCFIFSDVCNMLQQMLYVASVSWAGAARGRRRRWSPQASQASHGNRDGYYNSKPCW